MVDRGALGEFLRNRRGRIGPAEVGLPAGTGRRQTPGLRREELAALAGVSVDYYIRLERGRDTNPGPAVLDALATALRLDDDERAHLHALARNAAGRPARRPRPAASPRPGLRLLLAAVRPTPAYVLSPTSDVLAANQEGYRLLAGVEQWPAQRRNLVRYVFTHPAARTLFVPWRRMAEDCVAHLRTVAAADPDSPELARLVAELSGTAEEFAALWRHYDVRVKSGARRTFQHPGVGRLELTSEILTAPDGQRFVAFQPDAGSPDRDAVALLAHAPAYR
ncbi:MULTISPECIES: helix-turn-helix domain-containing protein [Micromonospora]|uniref:XRE family transcriptional regulator n=1 Tax=Micromonospora solifontis TaxID=2487138 RepID=A0ABX9WIK2_9ACTN|nr:MULTISPECIES: helix-turn-helix transcriptional regulator [Micromonospora]NES15133.1 helix-turn-helix transcriptional regulator [Micromonospora sp. PPF5-17B]NES36860.1 helix-turn-helix transcriptional regulator [Micromonospora solifontis]NES56468.1 helix-turn-helix transcriptional regulator [Micromonospora sp. PPF5-6]RNL99049.1 XRE family transcriptional regulator [Micromonospora solifontis]